MKVGINSFAVGHLNTCANTLITFSKICLSKLADWRSFLPKVSKMASIHFERSWMGVRSCSKCLDASTFREYPWSLKALDISCLMPSDPGISSLHTDFTASRGQTECRTEDHNRQSSYFWLYKKCQKAPKHCYRIVFWSRWKIQR